MRLLPALVLSLALSVAGSAAAEPDGHERDSAYRFSPEAEGAVSAWNTEQRIDARVAPAGAQLTVCRDAAVPLENSGVTAAPCEPRVSGTRSRIGRSGH
jgi:hypothetical protein